MRVLWRKRSCNSRNSRKTRKPQEVDFDGVKFRFAIFSVETKIPTILSQNLPCFLHLRFKQQAPSEWASDKKKGSMTVSFPKTWKFNHFLCLILSSLRKMSGFWNSFSDPFFHEKRWVGDSLTKLRNLPHENFSLKKEALDPKTPFLEGWALLLWL